MRSGTIWKKKSVEKDAHSVLFSYMKLFSLLCDYRGEEVRAMTDKEIIDLYWRRAEEAIPDTDRAIIRSGAEHKKQGRFSPVFCCHAGGKQI